jgi:hypothetical protein
MAEEKTEIRITKSPDFKLVYSNGVFGGLSPVEGRMSFYVDRITPKLVEDLPGQMKTDYVERELQVEVHMSPQQFISTFYWMKHHIERMKKAGIFVDKKEIPKKSKPKKES